MRHACLTLKERLFVPNTLEKLLEKGSGRTQLICGVQYAACQLHGQPPGAQAARRDIPQRQVCETHLTALSSRASQEKQRWGRARASSSTPPASGGLLRAAAWGEQSRQAARLSGAEHSSCALTLATGNCITRQRLF